jgi:hypothetical protein
MYIFIKGTMILKSGTGGSKPDLLQRLQICASNV